MKRMVVILAILATLVAPGWAQDPTPTPEPTPTPLIAQPIKVAALLGGQELTENRWVLNPSEGGVAQVVSIAVNWEDWFARRIPRDIEEIRAAGKELVLRFKGGAWTPDQQLDVLDGPIPTYRITWQGEMLHQPVTWSYAYRVRFTRIVTNQVFELLQPGDIFVAAFDTVQSSEMHMPDEAVPLEGLTESQLLAGWQATRAMLQPAVDRGAQLMLNVSPTISDWTDRILPAIYQDWHWTGANIFVGDEAQGWNATGFKCLEYPGSVGVYLQRNMLGRWCDCTPTLEMRRANLIGAWRRMAQKQNEGVPIKLYEADKHDIRDFPDVIIAIQAGGPVW